jgi:hypothetical protein
MPVQLFQEEVLGPTRGSYFFKTLTLKKNIEVMSAIADRRSRLQNGMKLIKYWLILDNLKIKTLNYYKKSHY